VSVLGERVGVAAAELCVEGTVALAGGLEVVMAAAGAGFGRVAVLFSAIGAGTGWIVIDDLFRLKPQ
jgi:hypothetical protein